MKMNSDSFAKKSTFRKDSGQIVLEYILLLVVGVAMAALVTATMVSRNEQTPGFLIVKWMQIITEIGKDQTDDLNSNTGG
jgi:hypothetical protein